MSKKIVKSILYLCMAVFMVILSGCSAAEDSSVAETVEKKLVTVGFSQLGAESDWRSANTESMKTAFTEENGYKLIFEDAQQKQTNQITAIRNFIQQEVDYIVLAPVTETGWDTVLTEAREANIPVIIVDRMVDVSNNDLFTCWVGSDFKLEGRKVCEWLNDYCKAISFDASEIKIVDIQGTLGSSAQIGRTKGFADAADKYGWNVIDLQVGDFTQTKGKEVMFNLLRQYDGINVVYCENDNEALGVIEALEANGIAIGNDLNKGEVMIVSFDGVNEEARENLATGKISCIGECNPLHGPRVKAIIDKLQNGEEPEKYEYVDEKIFSSVSTVSSVSVEGKTYEITLLGMDDITYNTNE